MKVRIITAAILVGIAVPIFLLSEYIIYPIAIALLSVFAVFELFRVMGVHKRLYASVPAYLIAFLLPILSYFFKAERIQLYIPIVCVVVFAFLLYVMMSAVFSKGKLPMSKAAEIFLAVTYVTVSFSSLSAIRYIGFGLISVMLTFISAWVSDVMAYIGGTLFGKHKLIPEVSPKKTVEGAISGVVSASVACLLYGLVIESLTSVKANYLSLAVCGLVLSTISQIGDLAASLIKREYSVKDYGNLLPGHGGIMDRFDSIIAVSAPLLGICILFPPFQ